MNSAKGSIDGLISEQSPRKEMPSMVQLRVQQLRALMWKCWVMRLRHPITMMFEIILLLGAAALLSWVGSHLRMDGGGGPSSDDAVVPAYIYDPITDFKTIDGQLYFGPNNTASQRVMNKFQELYRKYSKKPLDILTCNSDEECLDKWLATNSSLVAGAILFNPNLKEKFSPQDSFEYTIKVDGRRVNTDSIFPVKFNQRPSTSIDDANGYIRSHFILIQYLLNEAYLKLKAEDNSIQVPTYGITLQPHPYPSYEQSPEVSVIVGIALAAIFGLLVSFPILVKRIADEEANRSREMFRMTGVPDWIYWLSHFLNNLIFIFVMFLILTICCFIKFNGSFSVLNHSNPSLIILIFFIFTIQTILFGFLLTIPFNKPIIAVIAAIVVWIIVWAAPVFSFGYKVSKISEVRRSWCSMFPPSGLYFIFQLVGNLEVNQRGLTWDSINLKDSNFGNSVGSLLLVMLASSILFIVAFLYLDAVWPFREGVPKPFYFPFLKSFWCPNNEVVPSEDYSVETGDYFEPDDPSNFAAIKLRNVSKKYGTFTMKKAVDKVSMNISRGQITCLLGENGAGKTTTMSMITGMFAPSSGSIEINGYDLRLNTSQARHKMSFCPQHNPLYSEFSVKEHLFLYAALKGHPWSDINSEISRTIAEVTLTSWDDTLAPHLSGGMKRKLCLGIALIGGTNVVILDEPTTGLDPEARRSIWELLLNARHQNRTILISTHFMEEADALADRIAIMTSGQLTCFGSTMFLKKLFGAGYSLRIAKELSFADVETDSLIRSHLPGAAVRDQSATEVIYSLQGDGQPADTSRFPAFFQELEKKKHVLGVQSFGLSLTTMEEVFLKVGDISSNREEDPLLVPKHDQFVEMNGSENTTGVVRSQGWHLFRHQLVGLLVKRFHYARRYWPMVVFQTVIPSLIFILIFMLNNSLMSQSGPGKPMILNAGTVYGPTIGFVDQKEETALSRIYQKVSEEQKVASARITQDPNDWLLEQAQNMTLEEYSKKYLFGLEPKDSNYVIWFNPEALHSPPIALNLFYRALDEMIFQKSSGISVTNHPFPPEEFAFSGYLYAELAKFCWSVLVPMSIPFLAASYVLFTIHEKSSKARLVQLMTGVSHWILILANFLFDFFSHLVSFIVVFVVFLVMDEVGVFMSFNSIRAALFLLFMIFGMSAIVIAYIVTWITDKRAGGYAILVIIYIVTGVIFSVVCTVLEFLAAMPQGNEVIVSSETLEAWTWIFRISPIFSMSWGIRKLYNSGSKASICEKIRPDVLTARCAQFDTAKEIIACCPNWCDMGVDMCARRDAPMQWKGNGVGKELFMMAITFFVFMAILLLLESNISKYFHGLFRSNNFEQGPSDSDVENEKIRVDEMVQSGRTKEDALVVNNLRKRFGNFQAVAGVSFGVHEKECFGLLGTNGAGKTTTFRMITGDLYPDSGNVHHDEFNIIDSLRDFQMNLGYCPQFDPLLDKLTGREMLHLFGQLRGVSGNELKIIANDLIEMAGLKKFADKTTETYSGGNKRKLSLVLAIIGHPKILLLDEPTSGVDPSSRRKIWALLALIRKQFGCSIVLTSHSMQECESICSRLGIMVRGQFQCLGSIQHLRSKFGQGYTMMVKFKREVVNQESAAEYVESVKSFIASQIPSASIRDSHETVITYHVSDVTLSWSKLFEIMERAKQEFSLEDYSISDTSLEQIFISFAQSGRVAVTVAPIASV